jgi:serine/threonine protein kinase/tetratricopeptide (TPR) repeat protein
MNTPPNREMAIFTAALDLPASQRAAYLHEACGDDSALRLHLEALLRDHAAASAFLETPPPGAQVAPIGAGVPGAPEPLSGSPAEKAGDRIGRYKLLQQIGGGGCGVVYMAEQEEPVRRRVALKVIKLGMDTKQVVARFEAERQALALMDHPNIAKVFDAGATDTGRPYFVMELVRGIRITEYCDQNNLSTEDRLKLFTQVCQAIQRAHQKGIIHRDIKPSNILVTISEPGAPGCPKVIDFGIAKATGGQPLTDKTVFTAFEQFIGTPAYMSPEQAMMTTLDIDTRTDIYALGVLLYELLTGQTPFDAKELMAAGLDAMRRIIREQEPVRPSTRLSTLLAADLTTVAQQRQCPAPKLSGLIRGDLDWIVMKALEKDRARRYETANGLAMDIQRHLNCEPVAARPPSRLYEFQKTVRRHKFGFAAAAALITVLAVGVLMSTSEAIRAVRAEREQSRLTGAAQQAQANESRLRQEAQAEQKKAQTESAKSRQVAQLLEEMLKSVGPSVAMGRDTVLLREILDRTVGRIGTDLTNQPEVEAELRTMIGEVYEALGEADKAARMHRQALELRRIAFGNASLPVAESLNKLVMELHHEGKFDEADAMLQEALRIERKLSNGVHPIIAASLNTLAYVRLWEGRLEESENLYREVLAMRRKLNGNEHLEVAAALTELAVALGARNKLAEAESLLRESLAMHRRLVKEEDEDIAMTLFDLADVLAMGSRLEEAAEAFRGSLAIRIRMLGDKHVGVTITIDRLQGVLGALASRLGAEGKFAEAEPVARERLTLLENRSPDDWRTFNTRSMLGGSLLGQGKLAEAELLLLSGYEGMKEREPQIPTNATVRLVEATGRIVRLYEATGRPEQAAEWKNQHALAQAAAQSAPEVAARRASGPDHARHGRFTEAAADFARIIELRPGDHEVRHWQAVTMVQVGQLDAYCELRRRSVELFGHTTDPNAAERIAKDYLVLPSSEAGLTTAARLAETAASAAANHKDMTWFQFAKGLAEYRQGHFAAAVDWMQKVLSHAGDSLNRDVEAYMVLAMAQHCSKQADEANAALAKGVEIAESNLPKLDSGDLGDGWIDWIIAHALMREAKALIEGQPNLLSNQSKGK